jgi:hypothetical protein
MKKGSVSRIARLIMLILFTNSKLVAQLTADDSSFLIRAKENTVNLYQQQLGNRSGLINGSQYLGYSFSFASGHPYFYNDTSNTGSILYDKVDYHDIQLRYDEIAEVVICFQTYRSVQLISEKIAWFNILNHHFERIVQDSLNATIPKTGFYERLFQGKISVYKKETKKIQEDLRPMGSDIIRTIETKTLYLIKKNNAYYPVNNKKSLLNIYSDKKNEIDRYIKKNKFKYKKNKENMIVQTAAYYDQLIK